MEYFRKYLILIRRFDNTEMKPHFIQRLLISTMIGIIGGVILDKLLPFNFIFNIIRSIIAFLTGVNIASYIFIVYNRLKKDKQQKDSYYIPLRKKFSFRQRTNISIIMSSFLFIFTLLSNKNNIVFTLKTSIIISAFFLLIAFARKDRNEFLKDIYEIPDLRDLEFQKNKVNKKLANNKDNKTTKNKKSNKWYNINKGR